MRKTSMIVVTFAGVLIAALAYQITFGQETKVVPPIKVAVVDVSKVLSESQENLERRKEFQVKEQQIKDELQRMGKEADDIKRELEIALQPGTKAYSDRLLEWMYKQANIKAYEEGQKKIFETETRAWMLSMYDKLIAEIERMAQQEGISLVFDRDVSPVQDRRLLYNDPQLDLTNKLLETLNRAYDLAKTSPK